MPGTILFHKGKHGTGLGLAMVMELWNGMKAESKLTPHSAEEQLSGSCSRFAKQAKKLRNPSGRARPLCLA